MGFAEPNPNPNPTWGEGKYFQNRGAARNSTDSTGHATESTSLSDVSLPDSSGAQTLKMMPPAWLPTLHCLWLNAHLDQVS